MSELYDMAELEELEKINNKLDQLLALLRLANLQVLMQVRQKLESDKLTSKILENCKEPIAYSELAKNVATQTGVAEITVKRKVAELRGQGILSASRQGNEVFYVDSGLLG